MTQIVNLTNLKRGSLRSVVSKRGFEATSIFTRSGGYTQASITFYDPDTGRAALRVRVKPSYLQGRRSNHLKFGLYLQAGVRYFMTLFEDDNDKLDGTVSTAGHALGATTAAAVVAKTNSSALNEFVVAELIEDFTNKDYTSAANVNAADALPMRGGSN